MTHKERRLIAAAIRECRDKADESRAMSLAEKQFCQIMADEVAHQIGNVMARQNPRAFDWAIWKVACDCTD